VGEECRSLSSLLSFHHAPVSSSLLGYRFYFQALTWKWWMLWPYALAM
jgi:hypothetical protein